ncbi:MAG: type II toxin-antitoxin system HicA family toxin [Candidatus Acidiferrum sp.]
MSTYDASASWSAGAPFHPGTGSRRIRTSASWGSHRIYRHANGRRVVVAFHSLSETFPIGTLRAMIEDAGWKDADLRRLGLSD